MLEYQHYLYRSIYVINAPLLIKWDLKNQKRIALAVTLNIYQSCFSFSTFKEVSSNKYRENSKCSNPTGIANSAGVG